MKQLILGGARSGKSQLAERLAMQSGLEVVYIATATVGDTEMESRVGIHKGRRPEHWRLVEEPVALAQCLQQQTGDLKLVLVDCLTLWLSNLICLEQHGVLQREVDALLKLLPNLPGEVIFVSNEVGMGITPMGELSRHFQDELGRLHQQLASQCERVILTVAGLPHVLKPAGSVLVLDPE